MNWNSVPLMGRVISCCVEVHRQLGAGLLERAYQLALCHELRAAGIPYACEVDVPMVYKGESIGRVFRADIIVDKSIIVELKAVSELTEVHHAQLFTYLRVSRIPYGLLVNFNTTSLWTGAMSRKTVDEADAFRLSSPDF